MRLPNADRAVVEISKLRDYCLSKSHPLGRNKARVFGSVLGLSEWDSEMVREAILEAAKTHDARATTTDLFGKRFMLDFVLQNREKAARVRTAWIVRTEEDFPRFVTCYVLPEEFM